MKVRFLLNDVNVAFSTKLPEVHPVEYENVNIKANDHQFRMLVPDVAEFYAENGDSIIIKDLGGSKDSIELYLNGSILGAVLDQRKILTIHGSSFKMNGKTLILCGESGFGKSSIIYNLITNYNADFITDDITPISNNKIIPISDSVKLWKDALAQLNISPKEGKQLENRYDKYLFELKSIEEPIKPDLLLFGSFSDTDKFEMHELSGAEKLEKTLINQYWKNLTSAVKESRSEIFSEITALCNNIPMYEFKRPKHASIKKSSAYLIQFLEQKLQ